jgi:hypothetical protein
MNGRDGKSMQNFSPTTWRQETWEAWV